MRHSPNIEYNKQILSFLLDEDHAYAKKFAAPTKSIKGLNNLTGRILERVMYPE
jgi:hypothetical protein